MSLAFGRSYRKPYVPFYARGNKAPAPLISQTKNCSYIMKVPVGSEYSMKDLVKRGLAFFNMKATVMLDADTGDKDTHTMSAARYFRLYLVDTKGDRIKFSPRQISHLGQFIREHLTPEEYERYWNFFYTE